MTRREGRGRLNSIDLLPPEASPVVQWAMQELRDRDRMQKDIHEEFNAKLAEIGLGPISKTAFTRASIRLANMARRHEEVRIIASTMTERINPEDSDNLTILVTQTLKTLVYEMLEDSEKLDAKEAMALARAVQSAVNSQKLSLDRKRQMQDQFEKQVDGAIAKVVAEKGMSAEKAAFFRNEVLGVKK